MGSAYLFTLQHALKVGYFTGCTLKIRISFIHNKITLGYLEETKFCRESKAHFIHISSVASFKVAEHRF